MVNHIVDARLDTTQANQHGYSDRGVKCHTDRRSEMLLLGAAEGWIKGNPLSSSSANWCCGISPQGQELGHVEAAYAPVKGVQKKCSEKWENWENVRHTHTTKLSKGVQLCDVCLLWFWFDFACWSLMPWICTFGSSFVFSFWLYSSSHISIFLSVTVTDTDECDALTQPCSPAFNCINTVGSYMCQRKIICSRGYHASPDGSRCIGMICYCFTWKMCNLMIWYADLRMLLGKVAMQIREDGWHFSVFQMQQRKNKNLVME